MNKNKLYKSNKLAGKVVESVSGFGQNGSTFVSSLVKFTDGTSLRVEPVNNAAGEEVNVDYEFPGAKITGHGNLEWQANAEATSQNAPTETHATKTENQTLRGAQTGGVSSPVSCSPDGATLLDETATAKRLCSFCGKTSKWGWYVKGERYLCDQCGDDVSQKSRLERALKND